MWMKLRAWWYLRGKPENIPRDVREYTIRRYLKIVAQGQKTPEAKQKLSTQLMAGALGLEPDQISSELRDEMVAASMNLLGEIPLHHCTNCDRPVFQHEAVKIEDKFYCDTCGAREKKAMEELERIKAEVEKRRERAQQLGLVNLVFSLYRDHLRFFKEDFKHEDGIVPQSVTKIVPSNSRDGTDRTEVFFGESSFVFVFHERTTCMPDGEYWTTGTIEIKQNEQLLFALYCTSTEDRYMGREWKPFRVEAFLEGPWVDEIKRFAAEVQDLREKRNKTFADKRKQQELDELKKKFGL
jgi:hypothetical protein